MKVFCKYHPTRPAHWLCPDCGDYYCPECIETKKVGPFGTGSARCCVRCSAELQCVGVGNLIEPFWQRIPKIFLYALSGWPLALNIFLCACVFLFSSLLLVGLLVRLAVFAMLLKYAFSVLRATAKGSLMAPPINPETVASDLGPVFKQFLLYFVLMVIASFVSRAAGRPVGALFGLAAMLYVPAMIIMLAASDSLLTALNPLRFGPLAFRIGRDYLLMYFFLTILLGAPAALWSGVLQHLPETMRGLLFQFAFNYYTIIAYHLMGYVILQYHEQIGYEVAYDDFRDSGAPGAGADASPEQQLLGRVNVLIKEGAADEALALVLAKTRYEQLTNADLAERYLDLLMLKGRTDILRERGEEIFKLLFGAKRRQKAAEAYVALSAADPAFLPGAAELYKIAGWLSEAGKYRESLAAYSRFVKNNPGHEFLVPAYFASARLFHERFGKPEKAQEVLVWLQKKYPHHELMGHVRSYAATISSSGHPSARQER